MPNSTDKPADGKEISGLTDAELLTRIKAAQHERDGALRLGQPPEVIAPFNDLVDRLEAERVGRRQAANTKLLRGGVLAQEAPGLTRSRPGASDDDEWEFEPMHETGGPGEPMVYYYPRWRRKRRRKPGPLQAPQSDQEKLKRLREWERWYRGLPPAVRQRPDLWGIPPKPSPSDPVIPHPPEGRPAMDPDLWLKRYLAWKEYFDYWHYKRGYPVSRWVTRFYPGDPWIPPAPSGDPPPQAAPRIPPPVPRPFNPISGMGRFEKIGEAFRRAWDLGKLGPGFRQIIAAFLTWKGLLIFLAFVALSAIGLSELVFAANVIMAIGALNDAIVLAQNAETSAEMDDAAQAIVTALIGAGLIALGRILLGGKAPSEEAPVPGSQPEIPGVEPPRTIPETPEPQGSAPEPQGSAPEPPRSVPEPQGSAPEPVEEPFDPDQTKVGPIKPRPYEPRVPRPTDRGWKPPDYAPPYDPPPDEPPGLLHGDDENWDPENPNDRATWEKHYGDSKFDEPPPQEGSAPPSEPRLPTAPEPDPELYDDPEWDRQLDAGPDGWVWKLGVKPDGSGGWIPRQSPWGGDPFHPGEPGDTTLFGPQTPRSIPPEIPPGSTTRLIPPPDVPEVPGYPLSPPGIPEWD